MNAADMEVPSDSPETDERCRSIERGGRLVTVMPSIFAVTLQMPRGNLETIYPRALVLVGIRTYIARKDYRSAFLACRGQMVDMNILHDYAPVEFLENIPLFIDQVKKIEFIDEFLSRLKYEYTTGFAGNCWSSYREEDVCETLYKDTLKISRASTKTAATKLQNGISSSVNLNIYKEGKINRICDAFLAALKNRMNTNLRNLITAHICKSPPDIDAALHLVARLRGIPDDLNFFFTFWLLRL
jgi:elongator complex protein 1